MIHYFCPDLPLKSSGIRLLYRHVAILNRHGLAASILHQKAGFQMPDVEPVPVRYLSVPNALLVGDIVVIPEGFPNVMQLLKDQPLRRIGIALNWSYIYKGLGDGLDWRHLNVERVLVNSPFIGDMLTWAMRLPTHLFVTGINPQLYFVPPEGKTARIGYIKRKAADGDGLRRLLHSRNPAFVERIAWQAHDGVAEADYAQAIRQSILFLNLSAAEGLPFSLLEAMRCGTLVAGYNGVGGQRELIGGGPQQNCILAENCDYVSLATRLEPFLLDVLNGDVRRWLPIMRNGLELSKRYTLEEEERSVLAMWRQILGA